MLVENDVRFSMGDGWIVVGGVYRRDCESRYRAIMCFTDNVRLMRLLHAMPEASFPTRPACPARHGRGSRGRPRRGGAVPGEGLDLLEGVSEGVAVIGIASTLR